MALNLKPVHQFTLYLTSPVDIRSSNGEVANSLKMMNFFGISMRFEFNCLHKMEKQEQPRVIEIPLLAS